MGVLVAISIPIFTSQLEKAREATDMANIRSAYAELTTTALTEGTGAVETKDEGNIKINAATEGSDTLTATVTLTQTKAKWQTSGLTKIGSMDAGEPTGCYSYCYCQERWLWRRNHLRSKAVIKRRE